MNKLVIYYNFILVTLLTLIGFFQAQNFAQLTSAIIFFPLAVYFGLQILPKNNRSVKLITTPAPVPEIPLKKEQIRKTRKGKTEDPEELKKVGEIEEITIDPKKLDIDRRMFLKLIGSAGLTVFFFSLFSRKAHGAFFGSVPGTGTIAIKDSSGTKIDPAEKSPTDGFQISQIDDSTPGYYGFMNKSGAWYIQKENSNGDYRYTKGASSFSTNWTSRASLTYDYFDVIF